ncbi:MAG: hypothetical protein AABY28_06390 [Candidatus Omnitrophota bacterium]
MKIKNRKWIIIITLGSILSIGSCFKLNCVNIERLITVNNIRKSQILDVVYDYEKILRPDATGYDMWVIGEEVGDITAAKIASGSTVEFTKKELNMDYKSEKDYYNHEGPIAFRNFINNHNNNPDLKK